MPMKPFLPNRDRDQRKPRRVFEKHRERRRREDQYLLGQLRRFMGKVLLNPDIDYIRQCFQTAFSKGIRLRTFERRIAGLMRMLEREAAMAG